MAARYWIGGSGNWSDTAHWSDESGGSGGSSVPGSSDDVFFDSNSASAAAAISLNGAARNCENFDASEIDQEITISPSGSEALNFYGSFTGSSYLIMTMSMYLEGTGNHTFTQNGGSISGSVRLYGTGTYTQFSDFNNNPLKGFANGLAVWYGGGTWDSNGFLVQTGTLVAYDEGTMLFRDSIISVGTYYGNTGGIYDFSKATLVFDQAVTGCYLGSRTYHKLIYNNGTFGGSANRINQSGTIGTLEIGYNDSGNGVRTLYFDSRATITITDHLSITGGESGSLYVISAYNGAGTFTLDYDGAGILGTDYINLSYCIASPASTFYAGSNSTNSGNNTNWSFTDAPVGGIKGKSSLTFSPHGSFASVMRVQGFGPNMISNGTFDSTDDWTVSSGGSISAGVLTIAAGGDAIQTSANMISGLLLSTTYRLSFNCAAERDLNFLSSEGEWSWSDGYRRFSEGINVFDFTTPDDLEYSGINGLRIYNIDNLSATIDDVSIQAPVDYIPFNFTCSGVLTAAEGEAGSISGATTLTFTLSAEAETSGVGELAGSSDLTFTQAGELKGTAVLRNVTYGAERVSNNEFTSSDDWSITVSNSFTIADGVAHFDNVAASRLSQSAGDMLSPLQYLHSYYFVFNLLNVTGDDYFHSSLVYDFYFNYDDSDEGNLGIDIDASVEAEFDLDSISVKEAFFYTPVVFEVTGTLTPPELNGDIEGAISLTFSQAGVLEAVGELVGASPITFSQAGVLEGAGVLAGSSDLTFTQAGVLGGIGVLAGSSTLEFTATASMVSGAALIGESNLTFTESAVLKGGIQGEGLSELSFTTTAIITAISQGLSGATSLDLSATGTLSATASISGAISCDFSTEASIYNANSGIKFIYGTTDLTTSLIGEISGIAILEATTEVTFDLSGLLTGPRAIIGQSDLGFIVSGRLTSIAPIEGEINITTTCSGVITSNSTIYGGIDTTYTVSGELKGFGKMLSFEDITFIPIGTLKSLIPGEGYIGMTFSPEANLTGLIGPGEGGVIFEVKLLESGQIIVSEVKGPNVTLT